MNATNKGLSLLLIICSINLLFGTFYLLNLGRPFVYYEYLLIPFVFSLSQKYFFRFFAILVLIISDLLISISKIYYFDTFNFLQKFSSIFISNFSVKFWISVLLCVAFILIFIHLLITKTAFGAINTRKSDKKFGLLFFAFSITVVFSIDSLFGSSSLQFKPNGKLTLNFSQSIVRQYMKDATIYVKKYLRVSQIQNFENSNKRQSLSYQYLLNDSSQKQALIILESWGINNDLIKRMEQIKSIMQLNNYGYNVHLDSSLFFGGTSQAEVRELYNKSGEAYYSVIQHGYSDIKGLAQYKNQAGYNTIALQSFSGYYSNGYHFRTSAGFKQIKDFSFFKNLAPVNYNNHYISVNDEAVFDYGFRQLSNECKAFLYILTINTHLPFHTQSGVSELGSQYDRIKQQFTYLAALLKKYPVNKLVIVGDHPPPFLTESERNHYSFKFVPALIIEKKAK
jgi:ABC-type iron transport system FetAB permease component